MWSYYGSKANIVHLYPKPKHPKLIEYFAGSARYALEYFDRDVVLIDKYPVVINIWKWLQQCSPNDIISLPRPGRGQTLNDFEFDCIEAKHFMGFVIHFATFSPGITPSPHYLNRRKNGINYSLKRIASNLFKIKHWEIRLGCYSDFPNQTATHFIDPPYQHGGHKYICSNKDINFPALGLWCMEREGQIIVCENEKADWLPFKHMKTQNTPRGSAHECIWTNEKTHFDNVQGQLFHVEQ